MKILTVIPARKGSKGAGKNKKKLAGKPLIEYTFEVASKLQIIFTCKHRR